VEKPAEAEGDKDALSTYDKFWEAFGKNIKLGLIEDSANRTKISKLLRFKSSTSEGKLVSLEQYVERMKDFQKNIYYIAGESVDQVEASPFMEKLKAKGLEVLYLVDPIDEYAINNLTEFDGKKLQSITKEGLKLNDEDEDTAKEREKLYKENFKPLTTFLADVYGKSVEKVTVSQRVENTPAILVSSQYGYSANMERIMKSQAFADNSRTQVLVSKKTMEVNPRHPIVVKLLALAESAPDAESTKDLAWLLYDTAVATSGYEMESPAEFSGRVFRMMQKEMGLKSLDLEAEIEVPEEEEEEGEEEGEEKEEL